MRFRHGDAEAPLQASSAPAPAGKKGTKVTFLPSTDTFKITEFDFDTLEHRFRELAFLNSGVRLILTDARHEEEKSVELYYEGGIGAFVRYLDRAKTAAHPRSDLGHRPARRDRHRGRARMERLLLRAGPRLHQQHPAARRRHPYGRLPRGLDPHAQQLCRQVRHDEAREGQPHRRRHARGADRDRLGQAARSQVRQPDQGQARLLRGPPAARKPDGRQDGRMAGGESRPRPHHHPEDHRRRRGARSGAQGARGEPQVGARHRLAARQARRLPGEGPGQVGAVPGRGRQRRRLGQAGPRPPRPGDPAAEGQDPQRRARPLRPHALVQGGRHPHPGDRHRHRPRRFQHREIALPQDRHHDRRRRRRRPYPHAAAHLLLPPDAGDHRARAPLHRPAAALQSRQGPLRSLSQGRYRARRISDRGRRRPDRAGDRRPARARATICALWPSMPGGCAR